MCKDGEDRLGAVEWLLIILFHGETKDGTYLHVASVATAVFRHIIDFGNGMCAANQM